MTATTVSLINLKGGVGKTTLAVNLAWELCRRYNVLLVDLDPQFNATQYIMSYEEFLAHKRDAGTIANVLIDPDRPRMPLKGRASRKRKLISDYFVESRRGNRRLMLLPSELGLSHVVKNPQGIEYKLDKALKPVRKQFDYILIDCAPTNSVLTATALMASDYLLVPMRPDRFSVLGYGQILEVLKDFRDDYPDFHKVKDLGVVFTQVTGNSRIETQCMREITQQASYVFDALLPYSRTFPRSINERSPVALTKFARIFTTQQMEDLVEEMESRILELRGRR